MKETYHHEDLKLELIENGLLMIQEEGIGNLSLRKLAKRCLVSESAPYSHFKNKEDLLNTMQEYITNKLYLVVLEAYNNSPFIGEPKSILDIGKAYILFFINNPTYYNFIFSCSKLSIDLTMEDDNCFLPFVFFKNKSFEIYRKEGLSDETIKFGIISMWAKVQGITSIATLKNVRRDFKWEDKLELIIID